MNRGTPNDLFRAAIASPATLRNSQVELLALFMARALPCGVEAQNISPSFLRAVLSAHLGPYAGSHVPAGRGVTVPPLQPLYLA